MAAPSAITDLAATQTRTILDQRNVSLIDKSVVVDWFSYFFAPNRLSDSAIITDLAVAAATDFLSVDLAGGADLKCGQITTGLCYTIGETQIGDSGFEGLDYSHVETNIYGDLVTVERAATEIYRFDVLMRVQEVNEFAALMQDLRGGKRALWVGDASPGVRGYQYGFARDWQTYYSDGVFARARLTIQGTV